MGRLILVGGLEALTHPRASALVPAGGLRRPAWGLGRQPSRVPPGRSSASAPSTGREREDSARLPAAAPSGWRRSGGDPGGGGSAPAPILSSLRVVAMGKPTLPPAMLLDPAIACRGLALAEVARGL